MPLHLAHREHSPRPTHLAAAGAPTAPITASAAAFQARHGSPSQWGAEDFKVYLDLERAPSVPEGGGAP
jgi:hypothetical protein